ncbi:MAG: hypothetical protein KKA62_02215 [Nanoarchaeota archaeon]|nr:hypothetical protein [Nanoarchaeota archaeon]
MVEEEILQHVADGGLDPSGIDDFKELSDDIPESGNIVTITPTGKS